MYPQTCPMYSPYSTYPSYQMPTNMYQQCGMEGGMMSNDSYSIMMKLHPLVEYAMKESEYKNVKHAITEAVLIAHLMGMGYSMERAHQIVESWEIGEKFPYKEMQ